MFLIKLIYPSFISTLLNILNSTFSTGEIPTLLKASRIIPLYKSGNKNLFENDRPISLTCIFSKILEKLFYNRLVIFLDKYNIICDSQFGFRKKSSTLNAIVNLETMISRIINSNKIYTAIFIDFKKAFETVNHDIFINKLHHYGIRGLPLLRLKNYLIKIPQFLQYKMKYQMNISQTVVYLRELY